MTTFALIHGAWHGAWCWERLIPELERRGHRAVAVDLPCDDPAATTLDNAQLVADALAAASNDAASNDAASQDAGSSDARASNDDAVHDVVVVGHSLGGITAAVVPLLRPVRKIVLLCALIPRPGRSLAEVMRSEPDTTTEEFDNLPRHVGQHGATSWDPDLAAPFFYRACDPDTARWAAARLRPQVWTTTRERCPLDRWPDCELSSIVCAEDELIRPDWSRRIARDVLGIAPIDLPGGHFPMLSTPQTLADTLTA